MRVVPIFLFTLIGFCKTAFADTVDYWHVYYNGVKIKEFQQFKRNDVLIEAKIIKTNDSLRVVLFTDTPCKDCQRLVTISTEADGANLLKAEGRLEGQGIAFSLNDLLQYSKQSGKKSFKVVWSNGPNIKKETLLFTVRLI
jgi:hypothetical protein